MGLELAHDGAQFVVDGLVDALEVGQGQRVADAGDDVLALRVLQVVAVDAGVAGGGVAGEAHAGAGVFTHVAEHHGADVDGGTQVVGDALAAAVDAGALGVPGAEHGFDAHVHLGAGVLREVVAGLFLDDALEGFDEALEVLGVQLGVALHAARGLEVVEGVGEEVAVDVEDGLAEHLDEAAVGVPRKALVTANGGEAEDRLIVEADVQDGFHHAGHGELGAAAHGDEERVVRVAQVATHLVFDAAQGGGDLGGKRLGNRRLLEVCAARLGSDREAGGNGQTELRHLGEVGSLSSEEVLHGLVALGEVVYVLDHRGSQLPCMRCPAHRWAATRGKDTRIKGPRSPQDTHKNHCPYIDEAGVPLSVSLAREKPAQKQVGQARRPTPPAAFESISARGTRSWCPRRRQ